MNGIHRSGILFLTVALVGLAACGDDSSKEGKKGSTCVDCEVEAGSAELSVGTPSSDLIEGAPPVTVALKLKRAPTADVVVSVVSLNPNLVSVEPGQVSFGVGTWSASQLITLTPTDDSQVTGDRQVEIEFTMASEDPGFSNRPINSLKLTLVEDDETPSFDVATEGGDFSVNEDGQLVLEIALSAQPQGDVLVPIAIDDESEATIDLEQMTFGTLDWNLPQQLVVTGIDDREADGDQTINVVLGPTNSADELFNQLPAYQVSIVSVDGVCGNGLQDGTESCDSSGGSMTCPYGSRECTYCTEACEEKPGTPSGYCGDGVVQGAEGEDCDEPAARCPYGEMSCQTCSAQCKFVPGQLTGYCGDGKIQTADGEACDPGVSACCNSSCEIDTADCAPECLIISEYYDGSVDDKAFEIYNCGVGQLPLSGITMCLVRNSDTTCTTSYQFQGTLGAGDTLTVCNANISHAQASRCDVMERNVTVFNGDDRLLLFVDLDANRRYNPATDIAIDAFGQTSLPVASDTWKDLLLRRCNFAAYDGVGPFSYTSYYQNVMNLRYDQQMSGFGVAPTEGCF